MKNRMERKQYLLFLLFFISSFLTGTFFMNFYGDELLAGGVLGPDELSRIRYLEVDRKGLLRYVLERRIGTAILLCVVSVYDWSMLCIYGFICWKGLCGGILMTTAAIRYGIRGMLLIFISMFPQQFLLVPAWGIYLRGCLERKRWRIDNGYFPSKKQNNVLFLWACVLLLLGTFAECFINPILLSDFLKIF